VNTTNPNITGIRCFTEDKFKETKYQAYFNAVLILLSSVVSVSLIFTSDDISAAGELLKLKCFFIILPIKEYNTTNRPKTPNTTRIKNKHLKAQTKQHDSAKFNRVKRTTFMLFLITAFFFISYFPHLITMQFSSS
jgi:uncharacterized membrane protein